MCPNCKKNSYCGCNSCKKRKGLKGIRTKLMKGEFIKCPYCRTTFSIDAWESFNYDRDIQKFKQL